MNDSDALSKKGIPRMNIHTLNRYSSPAISGQKITAASTTRTITTVLPLLRAFITAPFSPEQFYDCRIAPALSSCACAIHLGIGPDKMSYMVVRACNATVSMHFTSDDRGLFNGLGCCRDCFTGRRDCGLPQTDNRVFFVAPIR